MSRLENSDTQRVWDDFVSQHAVGDLVSGRVTKVLAFGALIEVDGGIPGLLVAPDRRAVGSSVSVRIKEFDADKHRVSFLPS